MLWEHAFEASVLEHGTRISNWLEGLARSQLKYRQSPVKTPSDWVGDWLLGSVVGDLRDNPLPSSHQVYAMLYQFFACCCLPEMNAGYSKWMSHFRCEFSDGAVPSSLHPTLVTTPRSR